MLGIAKGPGVQVLDCTDKVLFHLSDAMQEHYEPLCKSNDDLHSVYTKFTGSSKLNRSVAYRSSAEFKEVDREGVKAWLAGFKTNNKEAGTKSNADKLYIP